MRFLLLWSFVASAQTVTRGPFLQTAASDRVTVCWRTSAPTVGRVRYGAAPGSLTQQTDGPSSLDHAVVLTGLAADTTYYYSVGTPGGALAGDDANHLFTTSPAGLNSRPSRFWVLGDYGSAPLGPSWAADQAAVRDGFLAFNNGRRVDMLLTVGDNAYPYGTDGQFQTGVFDVYPAILRQTPFWPSAGNHDYDSADPGTGVLPYESIFTLPSAGEAGGEPSGTERYYSFDYGDAHFIVLDSNRGREPNGAMAAWLRRDLEASRASNWRVALWHHAAYSRGSHDSDVEPQMYEMRENILPVLEEFGVDLVLTGHSHGYERTPLLEGYYGGRADFQPRFVLDPSTPFSKAKTPPSRGFVHVVTGSGGELVPAPLDHPANAVSLQQLGSVVLDLSGDRLDAYFIGTAGTPLDQFTILKAGQGTASENVRIYPNPYRPNNDRASDGRPYFPGDPLSGVVFEGLPAGTEVRFFSATGEKVGEIPSTPPVPRVNWAAVDLSGKPLASGAYVALISSPGRPKQRRMLLIVR